MKEQYLINLKAEDAPMVLNKVVGIFSRRRIKMTSLTMAPSDSRMIINICIEATLSSAEIEPLLPQIGKIIEVYSVAAIAKKRALNHRVALFKLSTEILNTAEKGLFQKYGAQVVNMNADTITVSKTGTEIMIRELYNKLDGRYLIDFAQSGFITDFFLGDQKDDDHRIIRLAA
jgi:acetolactate synthase small subunit